MQQEVEIHGAFVSGDLEGLQRILGHPREFPNTPLPRGLGESCLDYAIGHSPLPFIRGLLECEDSDR